MPLTLDIVAYCHISKVLTLPKKLYWSSNSAKKYALKLHQLSSVDYTFSNLSIEEKYNRMLEKIYKQPWFNCKCESVRVKMLGLLNKYRNNYLPQFKEQYFKSGSDWKLANEMKKSHVRIENTLNINIFYTHFSNLLHTHL